MNSIRITPDHLKNLRDELLSHGPAEAAGFLLAGWFRTDSGMHFVARELMLPGSLAVGGPGIDVGRFSRQVHALGREGHAVLSSMKVGIVGLGGAGSSLAEQLARLGVCSFVLADADKFQASNLTRVYGSEARDLTNGQPPKVAIAKRNILRIVPHAVVEAIQQSVVNQRVLAALSGCDVIFSCVDRQAPRAVMNEVAYQRFIPL